MRFQSATSVLALVASAAAQGAATGQQGDAVEVKDNPAGVVYAATLPSTAAFKDAYPNGGGPKGEIRAVASPDGKGVMFDVTFSNLPPKELGPFTYHLHVAPVPSGGQNCTATLAHLDPFIRGEDPVCDSSKPATCQVGDLSGKWGKITSDPFTARYHDNFASTKDGLGSFFGNRSFVLHFPNKTRIACANFAKAVNQTMLPSSGTDSCNATAPSSTPTTTRPPVVTAGASMVQSTVWGAGAVSLFAAIMFML